MEASQFKSLFLPCHSKLYAVAWRLTGNSQSAEDLVQETFLRLWTKRDQLDGVENAEAYSITILRRLFYDVQRSGHIVESDAEIGKMTLKSSQDLNREIESADEMERIRKLILQLPDPQGKVMLMRDIEDRPYEEISKATGLTEVNVRSVLSRARKRIREQIKEMKR
ncbi:RNA polymerase sigma factor [Prevotella sp. HUN102]|uniref:RNA polymerase sigma factor n=1 Tax=Prevotella sp. HUN102 TaxID=1392486 RepID=UPI0004921208|nr:RNA polymerase sigma factor [Prevotella sp. HUN102]